MPRALKLEKQLNPRITRMTRMVGFALIRVIRRLTGLTAVEFAHRNWTDRSCDAQIRRTTSSASSSRHLK